MTEAERAALVAYLQEQRRHLLAQARACEILLVALGDNSCYNRVKQSVIVGETVSISK